MRIYVRALPRQKKAQSGIQRERTRGVGLGSGLRRSLRKQARTNCIHWIVTGTAAAIKSSKPAKRVRQSKFWKDAALGGGSTTTAKTFRTMSLRVLDCSSSCPPFVERANAISDRMVQRTVK